MGKKRPFFPRLNSSFWLFQIHRVYIFTIYTIDLTPTEIQKILNGFSL